MFKKVLIANRGEIALRINRACHELGISTVAVYSTADEDALHVKFADESVCIGPPAAKESYLNVQAILAAAELTKADAIHPGYGFLAENSDFAKACKESGIIFIGPSAEVIFAMGNKIEAKKRAQAAGVSVLPSLYFSKNTRVDEKGILGELEQIGFPVLIKAAMGGGGRGMKLVEEPSQFMRAFELARSESLTAFGSDEVYVEKFCVGPKHVEFQVMGDSSGKVLHFGERDCSVQRRHQKLIEEALCPVLEKETRTKMAEQAVSLAREVNYCTAGTVEFILDQDQNFYFLEMNTRIQVEHPISEMVTGCDLLKLQIKTAAGQAIEFDQKDIEFKGHSIECRVTAEDPITFAPQPGKISLFHPPSGFGVRLESAACSDYLVSPYYDSMISKLIVHAEDRMAAIAKMKEALQEFYIQGIKTSIPFHLDVMQHPDFLAGTYDTSFVSKL